MAGDCQTDKVQKAGIGYQLVCREIDGDSLQSQPLGPAGSQVRADLFDDGTPQRYDQVAVFDRSNEAVRVHQLSTGVDQSYQSLRCNGFATVHVVLRLIVHHEAVVIDCLPDFSRRHLNRKMYS